MMGKHDEFIAFLKERDAAEQSGRPFHVEYWSTDLKRWVIWTRCDYDSMYRYRVVYDTPERIERWAVLFPSGEMYYFKTEEEVRVRGEHRKIHLVEQRPGEELLLPFVEALAEADVHAFAVANSLPTYPVMNYSEVARELLKRIQDECED
jgi:hypothetical protein